MTAITVVETAISVEGPLRDLVTEMGRDEASDQTAPHIWAKQLLEWAERTIDAAAPGQKDER